ncbi:hypothetical protein LCGC14_0470760 [marine sediment metagenome]|uniref:Uncharacterized protein n=1 Tax=marine sediment metagenome TaxID=412755 RepID=A0A0F9SV68_9ZZZZ
MPDTKPIGVAYRDPLLSSVSIVSGANSFAIDEDGFPVFTREVVGGDSGRGVKFDVEALAGRPLRQGAISLSLNRASDQATTWDGNPDAALKLSATNRYANSSAEGAVRGIDISARNRGDELSWISGINIGSRNDSGSTVDTIKGLDIRIEDYGTISTEAVGIDVNMSIENATGSPNTVGIRIRNTDASAQAAVSSVFELSNSSTNGFTNLFDFNGLTAGADTILVSDGGSAASTFAARLRVITPNGSAGWINIYSTSNDA